MVYAETEARSLVVQAGLRLLESGLIARTWGNISARISDTQFVITPSGLAYETLRPEQLVTVNSADCTHSGPIKPSSEKGIHADAYRLRPEVNFVIHTHQNNATLAGLTGETIAVDEDLRPLLGSQVPCAAYGMPSTGKLRRAAAAAQTAAPGCPAVLLRSHGALCLGRDFEKTFAVADALEVQCSRMLDARVAPAERRDIPDWGGSIRREAHFILTYDGQTIAYPLDDSAPLPPAAALHAAIYRRYGGTCIRHETAPEVVAFSDTGRTLQPLLDDVVQISGIDVRCVAAEPDAVIRGLRRRSAVLLKGGGGLCVGASDDDAAALSLLLRKGCAAARYAATQPGCRPLSRVDALIQRILYVQKYAKRKQ